MSGSALIFGVAMGAASAQSGVSLSPTLKYVAPSGAQGLPVAVGAYARHASVAVIERDASGQGVSGETLLEATAMATGYSTAVYVRFALTWTLLLLAVAFGLASLIPSLGSLAYAALATGLISSLTGMSMVDRAERERRLA